MSASQASASEPFREELERVDRSVQTGARQSRPPWMSASQASASEPFREELERVDRSFQTGARQSRPPWMSASQASASEPFREELERVDRSVQTGTRRSRPPWMSASQASAFSRRLPRPPVGKLEAVEHRLRLGEQRRRRIWATKVEPHLDVVVRVVQASSQVLRRVAHLAFPAILTLERLQAKRPLEHANATPPRTDTPDRDRN